MTESAKILLVDDEPDILEVLSTLLKIEGYAVRCAQSGQAAVDQFKQEKADVVVTDLRMPGMDGLDVLRAIKALDRKAEVIILTGHGTIDVAVSALKHDGAFDFLSKPIEQLDEFVRTIEKALAKRKLVIENMLLMEELSQQQVHLESFNKELLQTKRALEVSRFRYQDLYDQAPVGYLRISADGQIKETNQTAASLLGLTTAGLEKQSIYNFIHPEDKSGFRRSQSSLTDSVPYALEIRMVRSSGQAFYAHLENLAIIRGDGSVDHVRMTLYDIDARKQIELDLKESEERYRSFVQNFKGIAFRLKSDGTPVFYHGAVVDTTGYSASDLVRNRPGWETLIHPEDLEPARTRRRELSDAEDHNLTHEYRIRHKNRQWRWVREHIQSLYDTKAKNHNLQGVIFDITDQKNLQTQYMESRKLDAIATMAAGIAHQFNNSLSGLMGNLELLQMDIDPQGATSKYSQRMMDMITGMSQLTGQLLAYARGGKYMPSKISTHDMVQQSINLIKHRLSDNLKLDIQLTADLDQVVADSTQMQMVILAVMENALEAISDQGIITIQSSIVETTTQTLKAGYTHPPGRYICLSIADNGCGMPQQTADKIFDPFFTTKFIGRGLGLSAAYGIVINHTGWMEVDTQENKGTEIRIFLPLSQPQAPPKQESAIHHPLPKGDATILVVEDEGMVMKAIHELLERLEYRVIEALNGKTALSVLKTYSGAIDAVLLDVKLPDVEAMDLYQQMLEIRPDLKVIVCSGYNQDGPVEKLLASGASAFLQKPFSVSKLSTELKTAIEAAPTNKNPTKTRLNIY